MLRRLGRLLLIGLILAAIGFVVTRLMGRDEDFDDFDDLDAGFDFEETPVEIDVPIEESASAPPTTTLTQGPDVQDDNVQDDNKGDKGDEKSAPPQLTDVHGIGPAYEARLQAMDINTLDDLVNIDPSELAEHLDVIGGQTTVEDWISQARSLSQQNNGQGRSE